MNKLLLALFIWLSACAPSYTVLSPQPYYFASEAVYYSNPGGRVVARVPAGTPCTVIGMTGDWLVLRGQHSFTYFVPASQLVNGVAPASYEVPTSSGAEHDTYIGPRGGQYYYNGNGNKTYITPQSTINSNTIHTGSKGGQYYINRNGNKTYIKR